MIRTTGNVGIYSGAKTYQYRRSLKLLRNESSAAKPALIQTRMDHPKVGQPTNPRPTLGWKIIYGCWRGSSSIFRRQGYWISCAAQQAMRCAVPPNGIPSFDVWIILPPRGSGTSTQDAFQHLSDNFRLHLETAVSPFPQMKAGTRLDTKKSQTA